MIRWLQFIVLSFGLSYTSSLYASKPFLLGISTHAALGRNTPSEVGEVALLGANSIRDEFYWSSVQDKRGRFSPDRRAQSAVEAFQNFHRRGRGCGMLVLNYGHPDYVSSLPTSDREISAFRKYALYAIGKMGSSICAVEIWNEWNIGAGRIGFKRRYGDPDDYVALVKSVAPAIRKTRPDLKIIVGSVADRDTKWILQMVKLGVLDYSDGISVHPYNYSGKDPSAEELVGWTRDLSNIVNRQAGKDVPLYITEIGWPNHIGRGGHSEQEVAYYLARFLVLIRTVPSVAGVWWYDLKDDGPSPMNKEHNFGLYKYKGETKPAAKAFSTVAPFVKEESFRSLVISGVTIAQSSTKSTALILGRKFGGNVVLNVTSSGAVRWQDILGNIESMPNDRKITIEAGKVYLVESSSPLAFDKAP